MSYPDPPGSGPPTGCFVAALAVALLAVFGLWFFRDDIAREGRESKQREQAQRQESFRVWSKHTGNPQNLSISEWERLKREGFIGPQKQREEQR